MGRYEDIGNNEVRNYCVYRHITPVGKIYVGVTMNPKRRFSRNGSGYKGCASFYSAILKYGWNNIEHEILETGLTSKEADDRELFYIKSYRSNEKDYGHNILAHGNVSMNKITDEIRAKMSKTRKGRKGAVWTDEMRKALSEKKKGCKGFIPSDETRKKISAALTGRPVSEETRKKISESQKGKWHHTEEAREKMREAHKHRNPVSEETKIKRSESLKAYYSNPENKEKTKKTKAKNKAERLRKVG